MHTSCTVPYAHHTSPGHAHVLQASALVGIIPDLNMDMYSLKRQEAGFEALLRVVAEVLLKHVDPDTVAHCARTLLHCTQHGPHAIQVTLPPHPPFPPAYPLLGPFLPPSAAHPKVKLLAKTGCITLHCGNTDGTSVKQHAGLPNCSSLSKQLQ